MEKENKRNIILGVFVVVGFLLLVWGLYTIGNKKNMFSDTIQVTSILNDVSGLKKGNNVRFLGIDVGTVTDVEFLSDTSVRVVMKIREDSKQFIRKNAIAMVGTEGLMGNKIVNILPGNTNAPVIQDNDVLISRESVDTDKMLRTLDITNANVADISSELYALVKDVKAGKGTLGLLVSDSTTAENLQLTIQNLRNMSNQAGEISRSLSNVSHKIQQKGTVISTLSDTSIQNKLNSAIINFESTGKDAAKAAQDLEIIMKKMERGEGTVGKLLTDSVMANNLAETIDNAKKSTKNFNDNMEALKSSIFLRGYFKKKK